MIDATSSTEKIVTKVKKDIKDISSIYPSAFDLYEEPLDRLARRVIRTVRDEDNKVHLNK